MKPPIYRFYLLTPAFFLLIVFLCDPSANAQTLKRPTGSSVVNNSIAAGKSVGQIKIGDTLDRIFRLYPKLNRSELYQSDDCNVSELNVPGSLRLYIREGQVAQIAVQTNYPKATLETVERIKPGSIPAQVKIAYPNASKTFTKLNSAATSAGYVPLIFWVDEKAGIAFEFYTDPVKGRLVDKIHVFAPGGKIIFGSACETDEDLRELPPFALKVPEKMIRDYENR